ncbi:MAG: N-acetylmuramoyl-L-alanine amidase [Anaeroplasma bactoclasticum]|nr:N-acetylmuramoyl-L-alanine amidase [Anaeroplasma bactoclasticum]
MKKRKIIQISLTILLIVMACFVVQKVYAITNNTWLVYLDPGHGGFDGGATSLDKTILEKDITLTTCLYIQSYLEKTGIQVKMTRTKDEALSTSKKEDIHKRVKWINESNCILYVSVHANAYPASSVEGAQTFYSTTVNENKQFATIMMEQLRILHPSNPRQAKAISGKYLLEHTHKTGCLVELGFLTNTNDLAHLTSDTYLQQIAFSIYTGILCYIEESRNI